MTKPKAKAPVPESMKAVPIPAKVEVVKKPYVAPEVNKVEAKAEEKTLKTGKGFKSINSSTICQLTRRADRTFGIPV